MTTTKEIHSKLKNLIKFVPTLKNLYPSDVVIIISDLEEVILQQQSEELPLQDTTGYKLTSSDPMSKVIRENKRTIMEVPKEAYGTAFRTIISPVIDDDGKVIGTLGVNSSLDNRENLVQVASQLAASSEEISASTTEMSHSAQELTDYMDNLTTAYNDMNNQMIQTEQILELINSIAKSSRILGLNAGIEAARSGEHGRGFSIVAKEITKLADRSAESVDQIRQLLNNVKDRVDHVAETVTKTSKVSEHQSSAILEISQAIQHLTDVAEDVEELAKNI